jgi:hypothetical protein
MMMNNQEILSKVPEGNFKSVLTQHHAITWGPTDYRSLADIKRIVELEKDLNTAESIIIKTANNIIEADNCEQDSDEMNECWDCLKEFALLATGRCDT